MRKSVGIIGAGPGGLSAAILLANKGFKVTVFERKDKVGGRNSYISAEGYTFDIGPTFFMMPFILEEIFAEAGRNLHDYVELTLMDPYYQLVHADGIRFYPSYYEDKVKESIRAINPADAEGFTRYMKDNEKKMERVLPVLQGSYNNFLSLLSPKVLRLLPVLKPHRSLWDELGDYFTDDRVKVGFTFQSKYLGMSPYTCPSMFSILPYTEYKWGVYHVTGGLNKLALAMASVAEELGVTILTSAEVKEIDIDGGVAHGVELANGEVHRFDEVVMNADFAWGMKNLIPDKKRRKYTNRRLDAMRYSCSTFMLYLGLDTVYDNLLHHNVFIAEDYNRNFREIENEKVLSQDPSMYVQNASVTDPTLAPKGHSTLYVLVPVPNLQAGIDWNAEKDKYRDMIIERLENRAGLKDLRQHIKFERVITPQDWESDMAVGYGATFNLAHNLAQMLFFRPHNRFEEFKNMWLVGGGTTPGSGLPTIYESGRITARLISEKYGVDVPVGRQTSKTRGQTRRETA